MALISDASAQPTLSPEDNLVLSDVGTVSINNYIANTCQMISYGTLALFDCLSSISYSQKNFSLTGNFVLLFSFLSQLPPVNSLFPPHSSKSQFITLSLLPPSLRPNSTVLFSHKRPHSKAQKILFALALFLFVTYSSFVAITIAEFVISVREALQSNFDLSLGPRLLKSNLRVVPLNKYMNWSQTLNVLCGDSVVVWRSLIIMMLANTIVNIYSAAVNELLEQPSATDNAMSVSAVFLSFGVNLLATCLIYLKAWMHRRIKKAAFSEEKQVRRSDVDRVLLLIIESGAIYCLVQLIYPILNATALYTPDLAPDGALIFAIDVFRTYLFWDYKTVVFYEVEEKVKDKLKDYPGAFLYAGKSAGTYTTQHANASYLRYSVSSRSCSDLPTPDPSPPLSLAFVILPRSS
ncbi:hypothetical protein K435DRAFT_871149 [Dendrothele bispora CBS 962.96]|uniref:Uncharacterized protein n=1 Tax=Dendrothele bispora (strain CBS 962.96) TaxID=1314807 RepID=A0A4S8L588_DENBC|nr:hypothetical protein K435DRAFT_871149 [Dendrothele bispora CBS 962.96]